LRVFFVSCACHSVLKHEMPLNKPFSLILYAHHSASALSTSVHIQGERERESERREGDREWREVIGLISSCQKHTGWKTEVSRLRAFMCVNVHVMYLVQMCVWPCLPLSHSCICIHMYICAEAWWWWVWQRPHQRGGGHITSLSLSHTHTQTPKHTHTHWLTHSHYQFKLRVNCEICLSVSVSTCALVLVRQDMNVQISFKYVCLPQYLCFCTSKASNLSLTC
jgi:hypothetical protein